MPERLTKFNIHAKIHGTYLPTHFCIQHFGILYLSITPPFPLLIIIRISHLRTKRAVALSAYSALCATAPIHHSIY